MIQYPCYRQHRFSSFQVIIAGFAAVDLVGALLLMLPIAAQQRCVTQRAEVEVNSASWNGVMHRCCAAIGSIRSNAPTRSTAAKPAIMT